MAFAVSDAHAAARGDPTFLSAEHLYWHAIQRSNGDPDHGITTYAAQEALQNDGQANEVGWPYLAALPQNLSSWRPPLTAVPVLKRSSTIHAKGVDVVVQHLDSDEPLVLALAITEAFFVPDVDGFVIPTANDPFASFHAVIVVGYAENRGKRVFLIRNSWGNDWGISGHCWLSQEYLETCMVGFLKMGGEII